jgi:hypothetical protein
MKRLKIVMRTGRPSPSGLERVISLVRARQCVLVDLAYATRGSEPGTGEAIVSVAGDPARLALVVRKVGGLVDVLDVTDLE